MIVIRPIKTVDLDAIIQFPFDSLLGMTSLPNDIHLLNQKILHSEHSFKKSVSVPHNEEYYFVLEDTETKQIGGIGGILAENRISRTYFYRRDRVPTHAKYPQVPKEQCLLRAFKPIIRASEMCSLFILPDFRHNGNGRLLSLSRFLFIASHLHRFEKKLVAEMRGYLNTENFSPFWDAIGKHFCHLSYEEVMHQVAHQQINISEILPIYPIYVSLLSPQAQESIGKTHDNTIPALKMLTQEGFEPSRYVDVFDAGPLMHVKTLGVRSIKQSEQLRVYASQETLPEIHPYILSNSAIDFRACLGNLHFISNQEALVNSEVLQALHIKDGEMIRYVSTR